MPKLAKELSALEVQRLLTPGMHAVGGVPGLHLQVSSPSVERSRPARSWVLRVLIGGTRRDMGLGGFPAVTLADARQRARQARQAIAEGHDPVLARAHARSALLAEQRRGITFAEAYPKAIKANAGRWTNKKSAQQWTNTLEQYVVPVMGGLLVDHITHHQVFAALEPLWEAGKYETATRLRGRIETVLQWCAAKGHLQGSNPARAQGPLEQLLIRPKETKANHLAALPIDEMPRFMSALRKRQGNGARALEFAILTAARSGEVRGARWSEFDLEAATWTVPPERMKGRREHQVALSKSAITLLRSLPRTAETELLFPGTRAIDSPISDMTLTKVLRSMGVAATAHGFRSTFRDWVAERTNFAGDVAEMALAHKVRNQVEAAYRRGDMLMKRFPMMEAWAAFCDDDPQARARTP